MYCSAYWYLVDKTFSLPYLFHNMGLQYNADSTLLFVSYLGMTSRFLPRYNNMYILFGETKYVFVWMCLGA